MSDTPLDSGPPDGPGHAGSCITCGDVAAWMRVVDVDVQAATAGCVDGGGTPATVATELVGAVAPGDRLLVHAGTAIHLESSTRQGQAGA